MAVKIISDKSEILEVGIDNGDLKALNEIIEKWNFKNKESALRFAIAVLSITNKKTLYQEKESWEKVALQPTSSLIKED